MSGQGRPRLWADGWEAHNKRAPFYLPLELLSLLDDFARSSNMSKSEVVRDALVLFMQQDTPRALDATDSDGATLAVLEESDPHQS